MNLSQVLVSCWIQTLKRNNFRISAAEEIPFSLYRLPLREAPPRATHNDPLSWYTFNEEVSAFREIDQPLNCPVSDNLTRVHGSWGEILFWFLIHNISIQAVSGIEADSKKEGMKQRFGHSRFRQNWERVWKRQPARNISVRGIKGRYASGDMAWVWRWWGFGARWAEVIKIRATLERANGGWNQGTGGWPG